MASPSTDTLAFEVLGFRAAPALEVGVLELDGRFSAGAMRALGRPRLRVETDDGAVFDASPLTDDDARADPAGARWHATFAIPLSTLGQASFSLAVGRALLLDLPAPDLQEADAADIAHRVRLARDANALRRALEQAEASRTDAQTRADRADGELAEARTELAALAAAREALAGDRAELLADRERSGERRDARVAELERRLREAEAQTERRLEEARSDADRRLEAERSQAETRAQEALSAERERTAAARRELKGARAEVEAVKRELASRPTAAAAPAPAPQPAPPGEDVTQRAPVGPRRLREAGDGTTPPDGDPTEVEGVRVLGPPRARRNRAEDETEPSTIPAGVAEIGARHIRPGTQGSGGLTATWGARALAFVALVIVVVALLVIISHA